MPNWVTTKIQTEPAVIQALVNAEGRVDFSLVTAFPGEFPWDGIYCDAEELAEIVVGKPLDKNALIAGLQADSRSRASAVKLNDEGFEQFVQMLRNYRKCGFMHGMSFARSAWGTKWNACESHVDVDTGVASFETAWNCPKQVLSTLSKRFPDAELSVTYADEDIGSNCGTYTLRAGEVVESDIAPPWHEMTEQAQQRWARFAREVKGWATEEADE